MSLSIDDDASIPVLTEIVKPAQAALSTLVPGLGPTPSLTAPPPQTAENLYDINTLRESILEQLREHLEPLLASAMQDEISPLLAQATERISIELHDELRAVMDSVLSGAIYNALTQSLIGEIGQRHLPTSVASASEVGKNLLSSKKNSDNI